jgi:hypothetical protein
MTREPEGWRTGHKRFFRHSIRSPAEPVEKDADERRERDTDKQRKPCIARTGDMPQRERGLRILFTALPGPALLDHPHFPAVIVPALDDTGGKIGVEVLRLVPDRGNESCLGPGKDAQGLPADGMRLPAGTGLVTDTGHGLTGSKIYPVHYKSIVWEQIPP